MSNLIIRLIDVFQNDILAILQQTKDSGTYLESQLPPIIVSEIIKEKKIAQEKSDKKQVIKMDRALGTVKKWYKQYKKIVELEIAESDEAILHKIEKLESEGSLEILYLRDNLGEEKRAKIFGVMA